MLRPRLKPQHLVLFCLIVIFSCSDLNSQKTKPRLRVSDTQGGKIGDGDANPKATPDEQVKNPTDPGNPNPSNDPQPTPDPQSKLDWDGTSFLGTKTISILPLE